MSSLIKETKPVTEARRDSGGYSVTPKPEAGRNKIGKHAGTAALLSALCMGLGQFYNRQFVKGGLFLLLHIIGMSVLLTTLLADIGGLLTLGDTPSQLVKVGRRYVNQAGDHSIFMMIYGLIAVIIALIYLTIYVLNVRDAYLNGKVRDAGRLTLTFPQTIGSLQDKSFPWLLLGLPIVGVLFFTLMPIAFMVLMAFTNYAAPDHIPPKNLVDWVGLQTFKDLFFLRAWSGTFYGVLQWTVIWAVVSTVTCYFGGIFVALLISQQGIRFKGLWRTIFIIPYAIPQFISLLIMRNLLNGKGPINQYFNYFGLQGLPWLSDPFWAKVSLIVVNMWIGVPVSMLLVMGILTAIPKDLYEAAEVDGATPFTKFRHITLPYILFATAPLLITQFAGNINNFNVIFLLTKGDPKNLDYNMAGSTDLLVTWLYKLTLDNSRYNIASAVGIIIFVIIASLSIWSYTRTKSYKEEDMIQ